MRLLVGYYKSIVKHYKSTVYWLTKYVLLCTMELIKTLMTIEMICFEVPIHRLVYGVGVTVQRVLAWPVSL